MFVVGRLFYAGAQEGLLFELSLTESFILGAIVSATDPVSVVSLMKESGASESLFNIIFGESIFNDAVAIVLYKTVVKLTEDGTNEDELLVSAGEFIWVFLGSALIGSFIAFAISVVLKWVYIERRSMLEATTVIIGP